MTEIEKHRQKDWLLGSNVLVIPHLICNYEKYPLMGQLDKIMMKEYGILS